jgi:NAD(P)H-hydrate epimerase
MNRLLRPLSRQEIRDLDAEATAELEMPSLMLMENAGRGAAVWLAEIACGIPSSLAARPFSPVRRVSGESSNLRLPRVLILCGTGNNGGDGGVAARHLNAWGFSTHVTWSAQPDQLSSDAKAQWRILDRSGVSQTSWFDRQSDEELSSHLSALITDADWLVDGLLGTGLARPVDGRLRSVIQAINESGKPILSLDVPSGLDADSGVPLGLAVKARATATFVAPKLGFSQRGAREYVGDLAVIDIGLPRRILERFLV